MVNVFSLLFLVTQASLERTVETYERVLETANDIADNPRLRSDPDKVRRVIAQKEEARDDWLRYKRAFKTEADKLEGEVKRTFDSQFRSLQKRYRAVREEYSALGLADTSARDDLLDGDRRKGVGTGAIDLETAGNTDVLNEADRVEKDTTAKLDGALRDITEAVEIGTTAAGKLREQGTRLERTRDELVEIESELDISRRLISDFTRRLYTDKIIIFFVLLILLVIVAIIIFATINPDQKNFNVPEDAKPPTKKSEVTGDDDGNNKRLLRGLLMMY